MESAVKFKYCVSINFNVNQERGLLVEFNYPYNYRSDYNTSQNLCVLLCETCTFLYPSICCWPNSAVEQLDCCILVTFLVLRIATRILIHTQFITSGQNDVTTVSLRTHCGVSVN
jgi:hypothetical protein